MITFKIITELEEAEAMWKKISQEDRFSNTWLFRYLYYRYFSFPLTFYVAYDNEVPVAILPLQLNTKTSLLEFFGGDYFEDNEVLTLPGFEFCKQLLLSQVTSPARLEWMKEDFPEYGSTVIDETYSLPLKGITSIEEYIEQFWHGKPKRNLKAQIRKLLELNLQITYDQFEDVDEMMEKNVIRFKDESTFLKPHRKEYIHDLINTGYAHTITITIDGNKESIGFSLVYKNDYIGLNSGTNPEFNGLGKMLILEKIKQAIHFKTDIYEARAGNLGWKETFGLTKRPQFQLTLNK